MPLQAVRMLRFRPESKYLAHASLRMIECCTFSLLVEGVILDRACECAF